MFFFFQAEDGIRDLTVTGVQTCALPICFVPSCQDATAEPERVERPTGCGSCVTGVWVAPGWRRHGAPMYLRRGTLRYRPGGGVAVPCLQQPEGTGGAVQTALRVSPETRTTRDAERPHRGSRAVGARSPARARGSDGRPSPPAPG